MININKIPEWVRWIFCLPAAMLGARILAYINLLFAYSRYGQIITFLMPAVQWSAGLCILFILIPRYKVLVINIIILLRGFWTMGNINDIFKNYLAQEAIIWFFIVATYVTIRREIKNGYSNIFKDSSVEQ